MTLHSSGFLIIRDNFFLTPPSKVLPQKDPFWLQTKQLSHISLYLITLVLYEFCNRNILLQKSIFLSNVSSPDQSYILLQNNWARPNH